MGYQKEFGHLCEVALLSITNGQSLLIDQTELEKINFLKQDEVQALANFFAILGKSDGKNQSKQTVVY